MRSVVLPCSPDSHPIWRLKVAMWQALGSGEVRMIDRREDEECVRVGEDTTR